MRLLGDAKFAVSTFFGRNQTDEKYGANGLPLTPVSIRIVGKFQRLKALYHPNLAAYLDISRGKYDEVYVVSEYHPTNLRLWHANGDFNPILSVAFEILSAIDYLHANNIVHRCLHPTNILLTSKGQVRLAQYGLYQMTNNGADVAFPVGYPEYLAPEVLAVGPHRHKSHLSGPQSDIWSVGVVLLELLLPGRKLFRTSSVSEVIKQILSLAGFCGSALQCLISEEELMSLQNRHPEALEIVELCLTVNASERPSAKKLLKSSCFSHFRCEPETEEDGLENLFSCVFRGNRLDPKSLQAIIDDTSDEAIVNPIAFREISEVYHLWRLAGPDVETILQKKGLVKIQPPIFSIPNVIIDECEYFGMEEARETVADISLVPLSMENLRERLRAVDPLTYYPCLEIKYASYSNEDSGSDVIRTSENCQTSSNLPIVIKEEDIEYQLQRQILFDRLLNAYPFKRSLIWKESRIDIPPLHRRFVWAALLDITANDVLVYEKIDKITPTPTDRQIEVDVPRCHQYDELLSSHEGHKKFKRILKSWVSSHAQYVYWQGLDSLCAPFIFLNFNDEALAYACLSAFIPKYLYNFFLKDNSAIIHEYLAVFSHLIAFHDPELFVHLNVIAFVPELYAIPWFLTMFAHVFPLRKTFHLWDTLLLGNASLPLFVGVAIVMQLRTQLLSNGFNECILLFSDLPEIDIQKCVEDSIRLFCCTPRSATYRTNAPPPPVLRERSVSSSFIGYSLHSLELGMTPFPIAELKSEICPRICAEELMQLAGLKGVEQSHQRQKLLIVDIRPKEDFLKGTFPGSVNIPFATAFRDTGEFHLPNNRAAAQKLLSSKGNLIAVVGSKTCSSALFGGELVHLGFPKVCVLHNDVHVFSHCRNEVLTIPPYEL